MIICLSIWAAGAFPGATLFTAAVLCGYLLFISFGKSTSGSFSSPKFCFLLLLWLIITTLPVPFFLEPYMGDVRQEQHKKVRDELQHAVDLGILPSTEKYHFSLTRNRSGTWRAILYLIGLLASFLISSHLSSCWKIRFLRFLILWISIMGALGYIGNHIIPQEKTIWWIFPVTQGNPMGCFMNRNHFGGFLLLISPATILLCARDISEKRWGYAFVGIICWFLISLGVMESKSRGAFITYIAGIFLVGIFSIYCRKRKIGMLVSVLACSAIVIIGVWITGDIDTRLQTLRETKTDSSAQYRFNVWKESIQVWKDYSILGAGADAFEFVFREKSFIKTHKTFTHAESSYVQWVVDGGVIGILLMIMTLGNYSQSLGEALREKDKKKSDIAICVACTFLSVLIHGVIDVPFTIPLYGITVFAILGLIGGTRSRKINSSATRENGVYATRFFSIFGLIVILSVYGMWKLDIYRFDKGYFIRKASPEKLAKSLHYTPTSWQTWYRFGNYALMIDEKPYGLLGERCIDTAVRYHPHDYRLWRSLYKARKKIADYYGANYAYMRMMGLIPLEVLEANRRGRR